jgi:hypothetical protein
MIPWVADTYGAVPGWACARENIDESAARSTETSDQGLRPRMIDHFNEPASRATPRWALFALRRSIEGTCRELHGPPFFLFAIAIPKERQQIMGRRPRWPRIPNVRSTNPFDRAGHRSIQLQMLSL